MLIEQITHKGQMYPKLIPESKWEYIVFPIAGAFIREDSRMMYPNKIICANIYVPYLYYPVRRTDYYATGTYNAVILPLAPFFLLAHFIVTRWFAFGHYLFQKGLLDLSRLHENSKAHWFFLKYLTFKRKK